MTRAKHLVRRRGLGLLSSGSSDVTCGCEHDAPLRTGMCLASVRGQLQAAGPEAMDS
jgi:hypothetical protein